MVEFVVIYLCTHTWLRVFVDKGSPSNIVADLRSGRRRNPLGASSIRQLITDIASREFEFSYWILTHSGRWFQDGTHFRLVSNASLDEQDYRTDGSWRKFEE